MTVYDDGKLSTAQDIFRWVEQGAVLLLVLALLLPIAAILLSRRRRRTALQYAIGVAITMVLLRRLVFVLERMVLDRVLIPARRPVVQSTYDRLMHNLLLATAWMLAIALVAALVLALTGPYGWARRTRSAGVAVGRAGWGAVGASASTPRRTRSKARSRPGSGRTAAPCRWPARSLPASSSSWPT